ncbi:hypothetical protein [Desulfopila sp. IMCC35008]|uniref:hypothetical protein n=1 Tax=Desulfopila sp. IMCC35008 TaxID=2653858 RepID=UPI0013D2AACB|nr:hypothetical protein [Desulfopila sp. IMCC35008]
MSLFSYPHNNSFPLPIHSRFIIFLGCLLVAVLYHANAQAYDIMTGGDGHMEHYDKKCAHLNGTMERVLPGFKVVNKLSLAFFGGIADNTALCLTTLQEPGGVWVDSLAFVITELEGMVLEEITTPVGTKTESLESCWPQGVFFDDYNGDKMNDILLMISCFVKKTDMPENDNVVYISTISEGLIWRRQQEEFNRVVADFSDPELAAASLRSFFLKK